MNIAPLNTANTYNNKPSFTGASAKEGVGLFKRLKDAHNARYDKYITEPLAQKVIAPIMNSKFMSNIADKTVKSDKLPLHLSTLGSIVTTYFYASRTKKTLQKDEEQKKRAKTLMLNQWMVTGVSAAISYGANGALNKASKKLGYKFREANQGNAKLANRMKGFEVAKQLLIFTTTFRYIAPVIVTPLASKISKVWENHKAKKNGKVEQPQLAQPQPVPMPAQVQVAKENPFLVNQIQSQPAANNVFNQQNQMQKRA